MMPKSTESVSETDQEVVSDEHLMNDNICTHTGQDILLKPHSSYVLTCSSIFFLFTLVNISKFSYFIIILYRCH